MDDTAPVSFLGRSLSRSFQQRLIVLSPGSEQPCDALEWSDTLVVVEAGEVEIEGALGARRTFPRGAVLCLEQVPCGILRNRGSEPVVLSAVRRRRGPA